MGKIIRILMDRDGMTREDAIEEVECFKNEVLFNSDYSPFDIGDEFLSWFGLEEDYLMELMF